MAKHLVIVESPTKARTIEKFLGSDFIITSSYGHVRDLPNSAAEVPEKIKKSNKQWARLGVDVNADFEPLYVIPDNKKKRVKDLKEQLKKASSLYLATDEDREGESISWHLLEVLKPTVPLQRLVFHEITAEAIQAALAQPRDIDMHLVKAQETRRIIDRLFGYSVSPLLWKKIGPKLSAGRVQSVAMRLLVERERERIAFKSAIYWDLSGLFAPRPNLSETFSAELMQVGGLRVATGKDFDPLTGELNQGTQVVLLDQKQAETLIADLKQKTPLVESVEAKPYSAKPYPPFTTSTLQQEASRKFSFTARRTMNIAQTLYENGFITYMRTDSTTLSDEALQGARMVIERDFGRQYLPSAPRLYKTKVRNAQEAHEAIRPAGVEFTAIEEVKRRLGIEAGKLYELIWKRTIASQMKDSQGTRVVVQVRCGEALFRAAGKTISFPGFLRAYVEGADDPEAELADQEKVLPELKSGEELQLVDLKALEHSTKAPPRYTEGSLIKELERLGIGRPSTWAAIVDIVLSRTYAFKRGTALVPSFLAMVLTTLMERYFSRLVDYSFTARLEDDLDTIARGEAEGQSYLQDFYFGDGPSDGHGEGEGNGDGHFGLKTLVEQGEEQIDPREINGIPLGADPEGRKIEVRIGRYGPFLTNGQLRCAVPEFLPPEELTLLKAIEFLQEAERGPQALGQDPVSGKSVYVKNGRYGPYVQLGEMVKDGEKPKMVSLLPGMTVENVTLADALSLLSLPRTLGLNPENGEAVQAALGRYGSYVQCGAESRSIPTDEMSVLDISLEQALRLLKEPKRRGRAAKPTALKNIGKHPVTDRELVVKSGRFGPYVTDGKLNASLPKGLLIESITITDAVNLLEARAARLGNLDTAEAETAKRAKSKVAKKPAKEKAGSPKAAKDTKKKQAKGATKKTKAKTKARAKPGA